MIMALKHADLEVKKGEVIGLIGPNGAGKSTLIKIMTGVLFPTSGDAKILGYVPWDDRVKYVQNIGVIFGQKSQLWWDIPAMDTFELHKDLYGVPEKEFRQRVNYMIGMLDLEELVKKPVRQLSLGERMKCELVLCLLHNPKLVFLDEPTIGLDIISKDKIRYFVKEFNRKYGTTFLITTHDMSDIESLCKRVVIMNHGQIIYDGLLEEIRKRFANKKLIDCKFSDIIKEGFKLKGCEITKSSDFQMVLEVDLTKCRIKEV